MGLSGGLADNGGVAVGVGGLPASARISDVEIDLCRAPYNVQPGDDITTSLQTAINTISSSNLDGTIYFSRPGVYNISGAIQAGESSTSPATQYCGQILFPARTFTGGAITITIRGLSPSAITPAGSTEPSAVGGVVLKSTISSPLVTATLSSGLATTAAITSLPINALSLPTGVTRLVSGRNVLVTDGSTHQQVFTLTADAVAGATSLTVQSDVPNFAFTSGSNVNYAGWVFDAVAAVVLVVPSTDIRVVFEDITVRVPDNPAIGGINGLRLASMSTKGTVSVDVPLAGGTPPAAWTGAGLGVQWPAVTHQPPYRQEGTMQIVGFPIGAAYGEHTHFDDLYCGYCWAGLQPQQGPGHGVLLDKVLVQGCVHAIRPVGDSSHPVTNKISLLDVGDSAGSSVALESVINDPNNILFGEITVCQTNSTSTTPRGFKVTGAQFVKLRPYLGLYSGRWVENWPSDTFTRIGVSSATANYIGATDATHHVWAPNAVLQTTFLSGGGQLKRSSGFPSAFITYLAGRAGLSRVVRIVTTLGTSFDVFLLIGKPISGSNTANYLAVELTGGLVKLRKFVSGSFTDLATSGAAAVAAASTYTVDAVVSNPIGSNPTVTVYVNAVTVLTSASGGGTLSAGAYTLSNTEAGQVSDTEKQRTQDGLGIFEANSNISYFAAMPN